MDDLQEVKSASNALPPNLSRTRRRVFSAQPSRRSLKGRNLLLEDSDSDDSAPRSSATSSRFVNSESSVSFQDIISKLDIVDRSQDSASHLDVPRERSRLSASSDTLSQAHSLRRRPSRQMSGGRHGHLSFQPDVRPSQPSEQEDRSRRRHSYAATTMQRHSFNKSADISISPAMSGSFVSLVEVEGLCPEDLDTLRLLKRRQAIVRELVTTEMSFGEDLAVVVQEYQQKVGTCPSLNPEDARQIFGDVEPVMIFSNDFALDLQMSASELLFSEATSLEVLQQEDAQTSIGLVFGQFMSRLSKVFSRYCSNHERATACLRRVSQVPATQSWLSSRHPVDRTTAWDLSSLLIKPVQRVLKYPLLLSTLLEATPKTHPDYYPIDLALKEMLMTAENINNIKQRRDLVGSIAAADKKRSDFSALTKPFMRRATKVKVAAGIDDDNDFVDPVYDQLVIRFQSQRAVLQTLRIEIQDWLLAMRASLEYHAGLAEAFQAVAVCDDAPASRYTPAIDWSTYAVAVSDLQLGAFVELTHNLERAVFQPLSHLESLYNPPAAVMAERERRLVDFQNVQANLSRKLACDPSSLEAAKIFEEIGKSITAELPIFLMRARSSMDLLVRSLAIIQQSWYKSWRLRFGPLLAHGSPEQDIAQPFRDRFSIASIHMNEVGLTHGSAARNSGSQERAIRYSDDNSSSTSEISLKAPVMPPSRPSMRIRALSAANNASFSLKQLSLRSPSNSSTPSLLSPREAHRTAS